MKLYIDTTDRNNTNISILNKGEILITKKLSDTKATPESALDLINEVLKENRLNISEIKEIEVEKGPGSFTGVRVGVAIANALSFALNIPVNDKNISELETPQY